MVKIFVTVSIETTLSESCGQLLVEWVFYLDVLDLGPRGFSFPLYNFASC